MIVTLVTGSRGVGTCHFPKVCQVELVKLVWKNLPKATPGQVVKMMRISNDGINANCSCQKTFAKVLSKTDVVEKRIDYNVYLLAHTLYLITYHVSLMTSHWWRLTYHISHQLSPILKLSYISYSYNRTSQPVTYGPFWKGPLEPYEATWSH